NLLLCLTDGDLDWVAHRAELFARDRADLLNGDPQLVALRSFHSVAMFMFFVRQDRSPGDGQCDHHKSRNCNSHLSLLLKKLTTQTETSKTTFHLIPRFMQ